MNTSITGTVKKETINTLFQAGKLPDPKDIFFKLEEHLQDNPDALLEDEYGDYSVNVGYYVRNYDDKGWITKAFYAAQDLKKVIEVMAVAKLSEHSVVTTNLHGLQACNRVSDDIGRGSQSYYRFLDEIVDRFSSEGE